MRNQGLSLIEVMVALVIVGGSVVTLFYRGTESLETVVETVLKKEAMHIAEKAINAIYIKRYTFYEEQGYLLDDESRFDIEAGFTAEEILLSSLTQGEEEAEEAEDKDKEEKIVLVHISVTVTSKENKDVSVTLKLDLPADTADVKGIEKVLPEPTEK